jgi:methyl-accepting chemotaxis protein
VFWQRLAEGQFVADQFTRIAKGGAKIHIQASYNPILDADGKVFKVVKFATDVTERVRAIEEIGAGLGRLAECNIRMTIDRQFIGEFESLRRDFNGSIGAFQETLSQVLDQTLHPLNRSGQEMRKAAEELSERTRQQAVALEETAAALTQATVAVRSSTDRTRETRKLVRDARASANTSASVVQQHGQRHAAHRSRLEPKSARSSASSTRSPSRPTSSRSTPASRRRAPATRAGALRSSRRRCASWPSAPPRPPARSRR